MSQCIADHLCYKRWYHRSLFQSEGLCMANFELCSNSKLFSMYFLYMAYLFLPHFGDVQFWVWALATVLSVWISVHIFNIHYHGKCILCDSLHYGWSWTKPNSWQDLDLLMKFQWCCWIICCLYLFLSCWFSYLVNGNMLLMCK